MGLEIVDLDALVSHPDLAEQVSDFLASVPIITA